MSGYYPETDEEFYNQISSNLHEVVYTDNFPISLEEKKNLWFIIYETAQRYEEQKQIDLVGNTKKFVTAFQGMFNGLAELLSTVGEIIPLVEETATNVYLTNQNVQKTGEIIKEIREKQKYLEERLSEREGDLRNRGVNINELHDKVSDVNMTVEKIVKGMKDQ